MLPYQLTIKIKSLAAEARIIRQHEKKALAHARCRKGDEAAQRPFYDRYAGLHGHRTGVVRDAARSALLAYGYLRGRSYDQIEGSSKTTPSWPDVDKMVLRYGGKEQWRAFPDWLPDRDKFDKIRLQSQRDKAA